MCIYWNTLKDSIREGVVLYTTKNNKEYVFHSFTVNRFNEEVLKYSIPKRIGGGNNYKSVPAKAFCEAIIDYNNNILINAQWMKEKFPWVYNNGGCNLKVLQGVLEKYSNK